MKKLIMMLLLFAFVLAACSTASDDSESQNDEHVAEDVPDTVETIPGEDEKSDGPVEEDTETEEAVEDDPTKNVIDYPEADDPEFQEIVNLAYDIFNAQKEENFDYLQSILSEGSVINEDGKSFTFENVTYPHEMEFVQTDMENIEFRYTHEEEAGSVIVGFGVIDYETESSYVIDFQFVMENGEWKMNDMDRNA